MSGKVLQMGPGIVETRARGRALLAVFWLGGVVGVGVFGGGMACGGAGGSGSGKTEARAPGPPGETGASKAGGAERPPGPRKARWQPKLKGGDPAKKPPGKKRAGGVGLTGACDKYYRCCVDYATALGKVKRVPKSALQAVYKACEKIIKIQQQPSGQETCRKALEAMAKATRVLRKMPGFVFPPSCTVKSTP